MSDVLLSYRGRQIRETDVVFLRELELWVYPVSDILTPALKEQVRMETK